MSLLESNHPGCPDDVVVGIQSPDAPKYCRRLQGLRACPYNGQPQGVVPTWVSRRCRCWNPITGCTKISAGCKASVPVPIMDNHRGLSRRCRYWNPVTGCTKISASRKARACPDDDVVVGIQSPDAPKYLPVARPPCLSLQWTTTGGCPDPRMHQNIRRLQGLHACPYNGQPQGVVPMSCRCWNPVTGCTKISAGCKAPVPVPTNGQPQGVSRRCRCQMWCIDSSH